MGKNLNRTSYIVIQKLKFSSHIFRKFSDIQFTVHKQNPDHSRRKEIRQIVCHHRQFIQLLLVLRVYGIKLLVYGLQFFVGALQFLVRRQKLFVGGLKLLVYRLQFPDCLFQIVLGLLKFLLQIRDPAGGGNVHIILFRHPCFLCCRLPVFQKQHGNQPVALSVLPRNRLHLQIDISAPIRTVHRDAGIRDSRFFQTAAV